MDTRQQRRIAENETRFRAINQRIADAVDGLLDGDTAPRYSVLCECAVSECNDMIEVTSAEYAQVRSDPRWFVVRPEHIVVAVEAPVERNDRFWIIQKHGLGADIAVARASTDE